MVTYAAMASSGLLGEIAQSIRANDEKMHIRSQEETRPEIDDVICQYLDGSTLKNALNFINHVRASKMKIKWSAVNVWSVRYKRKHVLDIVVTHGFWHVRLVYNHVAAKSLFTKRDKELVNSFVNVLQSSMSAHIESAPALS